MERRDEWEWLEFQWPYLLQWLGGVKEIGRLAEETGAFERPRKIEKPEDLLQLLLMWTAAERSLKEVSTIAAAADLADVSDTALIKRFRKCAGWLGAMIGGVLWERSAELGGSLRLRVLDASALNRAGRTGIDHRLHLGIDLARHRIDSVELTDAEAGETLERFEFGAGEVVLADRGYGSRAGLAKVVRSGSFFIVRFAWSNLPLENEDGRPFDLFGALGSLPEARAGDFKVRFRAPDGERIEARLVATRKSEPAAEAARREAIRERSKHGKVDARTLQAAGYFFVLTNLPEISPASVLQLYQLRWQIEMKFKTLKSVLHLGSIPARTDQMFRVYVLAKILIALLIDDLIEKADSFSPWGYPISADQPVAVDASSS